MQIRVDAMFARSLKDIVDRETSLVVDTNRPPTPTCNTCKFAYIDREIRLTRTKDTMTCARYRNNGISHEADDDHDLSCHLARQSSGPCGEAGVGFVARAPGVELEVVEVSVGLLGQPLSIR
jgi:hypothetical protein